MPIPYGSGEVTRVSAELADAFEPGDSLIVVQTTGDLLHIPQADAAAAVEAVDAAHSAFGALGAATDEQVTAFYLGFASNLEDETVFSSVLKANEADLSRARARGRSTTRLVLDDGMRKDMIDGLRMWAEMDAGRGSVEETFHHDGWTLDQIRSGLGVVGFVFEGRPNVLADATGLLRSGNSVVFRIGSDAYETAREIMKAAARPALEESGLPDGAVSLVDSVSRSSGWALFNDDRLALAVARGSGPAVTQLGSVARQAGIPVSMHGTGGAWIVASSSADTDAMASAVYHSLDRKVCNTLNTMCISADRASQLVPVFLGALDRAGTRLEASPKLHITDNAAPFVPADWFEPAPIKRSAGIVTEPKTEPIPASEIGVEWEWEESPEVTLTLVKDVDHAVSLFNHLSPKFVVSLISEDPAEHDAFFVSIDAPFVGNGFTRWVDGQYALNRPELGLSNWQFGRLFGRGGVLSGDTVYTVRGRARQADPGMGRQ